jgi:hypothetical protein
MNNLDTLSETQFKTCNKKTGNTKPNKDIDTIDLSFSLYGAGTDKLVLPPLLLP